MNFLKEGKTNWKYILITVILAVIVGGGIFWLARQEFPVISFFVLPKSCESLHDSIEKTFEEANFCNQDADCKTIALGGPYIEFGCYKFVNMKTDEVKLMEKVKAYDIKCGQLIDKCAAVSEVACISNKCVSPEIETADWKTYSNEEYGFEIKYPGNYVVGKTTAKNNQFVTFSIDNLQIVIYPSDLSLDAFVKDQAQGYLISNYQKINFSGQSAYEGIDQGMTSAYVVYLKNKGYIYRLILNTNGKDTLPELKAGLTTEQKQILSSFKIY